MFVKGPVELLVEVVGRGAVPAPQPAPEVDVLSDLPHRTSNRANFTGLVLGCIEAKFCK